MPVDQPAPLFGENYFFALLLRMALEHCSTMNAGELDDFAIEANADVLQALADAGFIEIIEHADGRHRAKTLASGEALVARFQAEKDARR